VLIILREIQGQTWYVSPGRAWVDKQLTCVAEAITIQDNIIANPWATETCRTEATLDKDDTACHCLAPKTEKSSTIQSIRDTFKGLKGRKPRSSATETGGGEEGKPLLAHEDSMASEQSPTPAVL
jgi:hypothetical protein